MWVRRSWILIGAALLLLGAGGRYLLSSLRDPLPTDGVRETHLKNGLTVLTREMHGVPVVAVNLCYRVGVGNERPGIRGISHLLEHVTFRGTRRRATGDIHRALYVTGATYNGVTGADSTRYYETISSDQLDTILDLEADRMMNCRLDPADIERERSIVESEAEGREEDPRTRLYRDVLAAAYPHHPYGWRGGAGTTGRSGDLYRISRDDLSRYYRAHYAPNQAVLILVGDFSTDRALSVIRQRFGAVPASAGAEPPAAAEPPQTAERRVEIHGKTGSPIVTLAYRSPGAENRDWCGIDLLVTALVRSGSGWLGERLADRHVVASIQSSAITCRAPYLLWFSAAARPGVTAADLEREMRSALDDVCRGDLPEAEIDVARRQLSAQQLLWQDGPQNIATLLGSWEMSSNWRDLSTYQDRVRRVNRYELAEIARRYLRPDNLTVGVYQPETPGKPLPLASLSVEDSSEEEVTAGNRSLPVPVPPSLPHPLAVTRMVLPNGITILVHPNLGAPSFGISGSLPAGHLFDPRSMPGLAAITAQMLFATQRRNGRDMAHSLQALGTQLSITGGELSADIHARGPRRSFGDTVGLLAEMLRTPRFADSDLDFMRPQILGNLERRQADLRAEADTRFRTLFFAPGDPLRPLLEQELRATVGSMKSAQAAYFYRQQYGPDHLILAVSGSVTPAEARRVVERYFGSWRRNPRARTFPSQIPESQTSPQRRFEQEEGTEDCVVWATPGGPAPNAPDAPACEVLQTILAGGGTPNCRLGRRMREDQALIYHLSGRFESTLYPGPFVVSFGTHPRTTGQAIRALVREVRRVREDGVTQEEVDEAVAHLVGAAPVQLATDDAIARGLARAAFLGQDTNLLNAVQRRYRGMTQAQVNAAARAHLHPERATAVVVGPNGGAAYR